MLKLLLTSFLFLGFAAHAQTLPGLELDNSAPPSSEPAAPNDTVAPPSHTDDEAKPASPAEVTPPPAETEPPAVEQTPEESKSEDSAGEPIFDWSKHQGETEVKHPFAEKGLIRISRDRVYYYKTPQGHPTGAASVQIGTMNPTKLVNPDESGQRGSKFADNYDNADSAPAVLFTREWHLLSGNFGKLGLRLGSGIYVAQGHGHFVNSSTASKYGTPEEVFTFTALPNEAGLVYRFHFMAHQYLIPYVEGGGILFTFAEFRDDGKAPKFGAAPAAYGAGGVALDLTQFDYMSKVQLNREYGITSVYLTAEYRQIVALSSRYDFTSSYVNGGFLMEY